MVGTWHHVRKKLFLLVRRDAGKLPRGTLRRRSRCQRHRNSANSQDGPRPSSNGMPVPTTPFQGGTSAAGTHIRDEARACHRHAVPRATSRPRRRRVDRHRLTTTGRTTSMQKPISGCPGGGVSRWTIAFPRTATRPTYASPLGPPPDDATTYW